MQQPHLHFLGFLSSCPVPSPLLPACARHVCHKYLFGIVASDVALVLVLADGFLAFWLLDLQACFCFISRRRKEKSLAKQLVPRCPRCPRWKLRARPLCFVYFLLFFLLVVSLTWFFPASVRHSAIRCRGMGKQGSRGKQGRKTKTKEREKRGQPLQSRTSQEGTKKKDKIRKTKFVNM